jgi:hypothetical protein
LLPFNPGGGDSHSPVAIYTKHRKRLISDSIRIDSDCYVGDNLINIRALVEGEDLARLFYLSDLLADDGKREIDDVIKAMLKKR